MSAIAAVEAEEISENMEAPSCWICFEQGDDEQPLVRDCSCRGGSGVYINHHQVIIIICCYLGYLQC